MTLFLTKNLQFRTKHSSSTLVLVSSYFASHPITVGLLLKILGRQMHAQSALEFCPIHCPNGRLEQDLGFGEFAFALELPELLNRNLAAVRAKLGQTSSFPKGPKFGSQQGNEFGSPTGPLGITKPNWACQMGPIHFITFFC